MSQDTVELSPVGPTNPPVAHTIQNLIRIHVDGTPEQEQLHEVDQHEQDRLKQRESAESQVPGNWYQRMMRQEIYTRLDLIVESVWPTITPQRFLAWRTFAWAWFTSIWIMTVILWDPEAKFPIYLTNWNHTSLLIYFTCAWYLTLRHYLATSHKSGGALSSSSSNGNTNAMDDAAVQLQTGRVASTYSYNPHPTLVRFTYCICEHSFAWTVLVVVVYWSTEFPKSASKHRTDYDNFSNACIHAITLGFIVTDLALNKIVFVLSHAWYTMAISIVYLIVNGIYCAASGTFIYQILKWDGIGTAAAIIGCALFLIAMYPLGYWIGLQRNRMAGWQPPVAPGKWCLCARPSV